VESTKILKIDPADGSLLSERIGSSRLLLEREGGSGGRTFPTGSRKEKSAINDYRLSAFWLRARPLLAETSTSEYVAAYRMACWRWYAWILTDNRAFTAQRDLCIHAVRPGAWF